MARYQLSFALTRKAMPARNPKCCRSSEIPSTIYLLMFIFGNVKHD
jgi:hypothetical protein